MSNNEYLLILIFIIVVVIWSAIASHFLIDLISDTKENNEPTNNNKHDN